MARAARGGCHLAGLLATLLIGAACAPPEVDLIVELRTDLRPELAFTTARVELFDGRPTSGAAPVRTMDAALTASDPVFTGHRVAEIADLATGSYGVRVTLLDPEGRFVAERTLLIELSESSAVTALITSDCRRVECPRPGDDADATTCAGGACVDPSCAGAACGPSECAVDADCVADACTRPRCVDGSCFFVPDDEVCAAGQICDPVRGCRVACAEALSWESDFSEDPTTLDLDGDGTPDWVSRLGNFDASNVDAGSWQPFTMNQFLDTNPPNRFTSRLIARARMRATTPPAGLGGAVLWANVDTDATTFAAIYVNLEQQPDATETISLRMRIASGAPGMVLDSVSGLRGLVDVTLDIDPASDTVGWWINGEDRGRHPYVRFDPGPDLDDQFATVGSFNPGTEVDYVHVALCR